MHETWCKWHSRYCRECWVQKLGHAAQVGVFFLCMTTIGVAFVVYSEEVDAFVNRLSAGWQAFVAVVSK